MHDCLLEARKAIELLPSDLDAAMAVGRIFRLLEAKERNEASRRGIIETKSSSASI
jgi:hypothetical protein